MKEAGQASVHARIVLWGIEGAGKTASMSTIHSKLREDLRGDLKHEPTRLDPTVHYETLPISLGEVGGVGTQIELIAVPGAEDQAMTRKQLLDQVDGVVLILDCSPDRIEANWDAIHELRTSLEAYGHTLENFPLVLQYNKRDIADPFAIEDLHRRIGLESAAVFETIATTGHGILATLTTISKHVVRNRRTRSSENAASTDPAEAAPPQAVAPELGGENASDLLEAAILAEADDTGLEEIAEGVAFDAPSNPAQPDWNATTEPEIPAAATKPGLNPGLRIVSVGQARADAERGVRLPLVLGDDAGQTISVVLTLDIEPLLEDGGD